MKTPRFSTQGFSLVEVVLALGVTAFALVIILGLLPAGLGTNRASVEQTVAVNLVTAIVADLRQAPTTSAIAASGSSTPLAPQSPKYGIDVTKPSDTFFLDDSGNSSASLTATSRYRVVVTLTPPPAGERLATYGVILVSWPAAATAPLNSVSAFIALDRN